MSRPIDYDDLPPDVRARVPKGIKVGEQSPLLAARGAQAARKRQRVGKSLEQELELVHQLYELRGRARIRKQHPATFIQGEDKRGPVLRFAKGGAAVDYAGSAYVDGESRTIAFDLKSETDATYVHDPKQIHQLTELLARRDFDELAFLLIICAPMKVGYLVTDPAALRALEHGQELLLRRPRFAGVGSGRRVANDPRAFDHLVPHFLAPQELLVSPDVVRWDWLNRLETLIQEGT